MLLSTIAGIAGASLFESITRRASRRGRITFEHVNGSWVAVIAGEVSRRAVIRAAIKYGLHKSEARRVAFEAMWESDLRIW